MRLVVGIFLLFIGCSSPSNAPDNTPKQSTNEQEKTSFIDNSASDNFAQLEESIQILLAKFSNKIPSKPYRVSVGNFVLSDNKIPSSFSSYAFDETSIAVNKIDFFTEFPRDQLDTILNEQKISINDLFEPDTSVKMGELKGVQGIINGNYRIFGDKVKLYIRLLDIETGQSLGKDSLTINVSDIPSNLEMQPSNYNQSIKVLSSFTAGKKSDFKIKTWVNKGDGSTYKIGEKMIIYFTSNTDCFLKLYNVDVKGNINVIFPNKFKQNNEIIANQVYRIPDKSDNFKFTMREPIGTEIIKAVASTTPFVKDESANIGSANSSKEEIAHIFSRSVSIERGIEITANKVKPKTAEATCIYTIVK